MLLVLFAPLTSCGQTKSIEQKMNEIIIPRVEFRDANPTDVLNFFTEACTFPEPDISGLSHISTNSIFYTYEVEDGSPLELPPLTLEYRDVSMTEAFDRFTKEMGLTYRLENDTLVFFTQDGKRIIRKNPLNKRVQGTLHKVSGPLTPDVGHHNYATK
jgi:hypothetical protein